MQLLFSITLWLASSAARNQNWSNMGASFWFWCWRSLWGQRTQRWGNQQRSGQQSRHSSSHAKRRSQTKSSKGRMRFQNQTSAGFHSCIEQILSQYRYKLLQAYAPSKLHFPATFNLIRYNDFFPLRSSVDYRSHFKKCVWDLAIQLLFEGFKSFIPLWMKNQACKYSSRNYHWVKSPRGKERIFYRYSRFVGLAEELNYILFR